MGQPNMNIVSAYGGTMEIDAAKSRIRIGGHEVAFHCDKFNTRIIKGLEDVVGVKDAAKLLIESSEQAAYGMFTDFFQGDTKAAFDALAPEDKMATLIEIGKMLGYGAVTVNSVSDAGGDFTSPSSYLAEGWLENMNRWNWKLRDNPACYDMSGYLAAALAYSYGKEPGTYKVLEGNCRAKGDDVCTFKAEVK